MKTLLKTDSFTPINYHSLLDEWVDAYLDPFYQKTYVITQDKDKSLAIIESTFEKGMKRCAIHNKHIEIENCLGRILYMSIAEEFINSTSQNNNISQIKATLLSLPDRQRSAFALKTFANLRTMDICEVLEITEQQFWTSVNQTRRALISA